MKNYLGCIVVSMLVSFGVLSLQGCGGGGAWRYDPGIPVQVSGLKAEAGNRVVTLSWTGNDKARTYNVYYVSALTADGVTRANATKINTKTFSTVIAQLDNNIEYHFMVTALNSKGESIDSIQVSATPSPISIASLMGSSLLVAADIGDVSALSARLQDDPDPLTRPVSQWIWGALDNSIKLLLADPGSTAPQRQAALLQGLNSILQGSSIYEQTRFAGVSLRPEADTLLAEDPKAESLLFLNRFLLEDVYPQLIGKQVGIWYFHTLVTDPDAGWERGTLTVDDDGIAVISEFEDSAGNTQAPPGFVLGIFGIGELSQSGDGAWVGFHGTMGSRKNMMTATWSPSLQSRALTIFQKKKADSDPDYSVEDIGGTGSGQNPNNPYLQGNGPTRFVYHQLYSGSNTEWEYCNAKVGQHGNVWLEQYKDIIYWDFSTPLSKTINYDYLWKVTSVGVEADGKVTEYWNFNDVVDPVKIPSFNTLVPKIAHDIVFSGRMTADKTVVIGVATRTDASGNNPHYFLRIMQLCFIPTDQALPTPGLNDLAGNYRFHKLASGTPAGSTVASASWAHGSMSINGSGLASFPRYSDSNGASQLSDSLMFSYYSDTDNNPDLKEYTDFANFTTPVQDGRARYFDAGGKALRSYYDFASFGSSVGIPSTWRLEDTSTKYYNEHGSLSYNRDLFVMTGTDASGYSMLIGLK